jgi:hypothetical protein
MKRVTVTNNASGAVTNMAELDDAKVTPWINDHVSRNVFGLPGTYTITTVDMQPEIDAENQRQASIIIAKARLKALSQQDDLSSSETKEAVIKLLKLDFLQKLLD